MAGEEDAEIPASGAVFTFGKSRFADNVPSHFFIRNDPVIDVDCGDEHTAVVCQNGRVFVFGNNEWGQLGLGHQSVVNKPSCVKSLKPEHATHVACGRAHTLISTGTGKVYSCGSNSDGQLGLGDTTDRDIPCEVEGITGTVEQLAAGCNHSVALNNMGQVYVWGSNADGQLGLGQDIKSVSVPTILPLQESIASIACGYYHTLFLTEEGQALVCGEGEGGKLGLGSTDNVYVPTLVPLEAFLLFITAGGNHTIAIAVDGKVYGWGSNSNGQLGLTEWSESEITKPTIINSLSGRVIKEAACGESHTGFITENGELLTCGEARHGKLGCEVSGTRDAHYNLTPVKVPKFKGFCVTKVKCGGCHTIALASPSTNDMDEQMTIVSNGHIVSPSKTLQPPESGIISPPPISARGPLPPLQRVPLPVPSNNKPESVPKSYPESLSSFNNDIHHSENNHIINDNPQNPNDHEIVNENSSVLSIRLQNEPKENRSVKDFEVTSLNGSVTVVNSPQHSANRVSKVKQCNIQCLSDLSTNDKVEVLSTVSDGDDVVYVISCNGWNNPLDHQMFNELNKNLNNTNLKLWLEGLADEISDSSGSFRGNKRTDKVRSAQNNKVKSDEDLINNRTFSIKQNSDDENTSDSEVLPIDKFEEDLTSGVRDRFPNKCLPDVIQTKEISDQICSNNCVKKDSASSFISEECNLPDDCSNSIKSMPNFYKYFPPKKILNIAESDEITYGKTYLLSNVETCKEVKQLNSNSERECGCTTEEEEVINVINDKNLAASCLQFSNRAERNLSQDPYDVNIQTFKKSDRTTLNSPTNSYLMICKKERKSVNSDADKFNEIHRTENVFNMSKGCVKNCKDAINCQNVKQNIFEKEINLKKNANINTNINGHQQAVNRCNSLSKNNPERGKTMEGVKSDFLLNCKYSMENDKKTCIENKYLLIRNKNVNIQNGDMFNVSNANNSFDNEIQLNKSERKENNMDRKRRKDYVKRNIWCGERLRGGEDTRYEDFNRIWKKIEMQNLKNIDSSKLFFEVPEQSIEEEGKKVVSTEIMVQPAYSNNVEVEDEINKSKSQVRSGGRIRNFLTLMKRTPSMQSEDKISSANICNDLHEEKKTVDATMKAKSKVKSKMCTIL